MCQKQRDDVWDNIAKHNELQVEVGTVATAQVCRLSERTHE